MIKRKNILKIAIDSPAAAGAGTSSTSAEGASAALTHAFGTARFDG